MYWTDKAALVTGGSAGLGLAIARALAEAGAKVTIAARDQVRLAAAAQRVAAAGGTCDAIAADVTRQADCERLVGETIAARSRLDLLVNCAGRSTRGEASATTADQFAELIDVNFLSAVRVTHAALPHLVASRGHLVFIGSLASKAGARYLGAYPASKFPLAAYAQQLRLELGPQGLHTLLVCPGPIRRDDAGQRYESAAENLPEEARRPGGGVKLQGIDPDWLARRILVSCQRRKAELVVPGRARLLFAISQFWPSLGDWIVTQMTK
ncbi:MAG: SDR family NAD(P)-dependent oxidoreductase [Planctomycetaceae bacterium]|nr:SDR family NAD(P)-dependent oxidoreductase [Planctomycetaceae bacterium]